MSNVIPFPIARAAATPQDPDADLSDMRAATADGMRELLKLAFPKRAHDLSGPLVLPAGSGDQQMGARDRLSPGEVEALRRSMLNVVHEFARQTNATSAAVVEALDGIVARRFYRAAVSAVPIDP